MKAIYIISKVDGKKKYYYTGERGEYDDVKTWERKLDYHIKTYTSYDYAQSIVEKLMEAEFGAPDLVQIEKFYVK